jgi:hypothetical protein
MRTCLESIFSERTVGKIEKSSQLSLRLYFHTVSVIETVKRGARYDLAERTVKWTVDP